MLQHSGIRLIYLPPYSPDLNPIEECFSFVKHYIRHHGTEFCTIVEFGNELAPFSFLYTALDQVTAESSQDLFHHVGYV